MTNTVKESVENTRNKGSDYGGKVLLDTTLVLRDNREFDKIEVFEFFIKENKILLKKVEENKNQMDKYWYQNIQNVWLFNLNTITLNSDDNKEKISKFLSEMNNYIDLLKNANHKNKKNFYHKYEDPSKNTITVFSWK